MNEEHSAPIDPTLAAPSDLEAFFRRLEQARTQAIVKRDLPAMERMHAPGYQLITPSARVFSRERYFAAVAAAPFYAAWECGPMRVRVSPAMSVVRYQARLVFPSGTVINCWHTDTYEKQGSEWLAVWSQATEIPTVTGTPQGKSRATLIPSPTPR